MKKIVSVLIFFISYVNYAQDPSSVYRSVEEITLNDGLQNQYHEFESFWKVVKEKHVKEGKQTGWFVWKVDPSNSENPWAEYLIINVFANKGQMEEMNSKTPDWWQNEIKIAHKGKTKRSVVKKYIKETVDNKYRKKSVTYTNKGLDAFMLEGVVPSVGIKGAYIGIEQLNEDYVGFETKFFAPWHKKSKTRLYWEINEIIDRSENAYKPVTHMIFEIPNPDNLNPDLSNLSFTDEMMSKYGVASRKFHGTLNSELVLYAW
jgi:hypothetical protein